MTKALFAIIGRDLRAAYLGGGVLLPIIFFLLVATLLVFAIGPERDLLARMGGGALWMAGLLAALLPIDRLISGDAEAGMLDLYAVREIPEEMVAIAKLIAHWLGFGPPLMLAAIPGALLLGLNFDVTVRLELSLLIGMPGLAALSLIVAALTAGLRGTGSLAGLLMLPLAVPLLIFGAGALQEGGVGALKLLAALSILYVVATPWVVAAAIRALRE